MQPTYHPGARSPDSPECVEGVSVLKNPSWRSPSPQIVYQTHWFWDVSSPILGRHQLNADFFNRLGCSANFGLTAFSEVRIAPVQYPSVPRSTTLLLTNNTPRRAPPFCRVPGQ
jgi:hypothetical protein